VTAYPIIDEKLSGRHRAELLRAGIPNEAINRIEFEIIDLKSQRVANTPPSSAEKLLEIAAFSKALDALGEGYSQLSSETRQMIQAHAWPLSVETGKPKTSISLGDFFHAAMAFSFGADDAAVAIRLRSTGRRDEPEIQRKLAIRILRIFQQFDCPRGVETKSPLVTAIAIGCEVIDISGGEPRKFAQYAIEETSTGKQP
jgi:hypothetical protein